MNPFYIRFCSRTSQKAGDKEVAQTVCAGLHLVDNSSSYRGHRFIDRGVRLQEPIQAQDPPSHTSRVGRPPCIWRIRRSLVAQPRSERAGNAAANPISLARTLRTERFAPAHCMTSRVAV